MSEQPVAVVDTPAEESVNDSEEQGENTEDTLEPACKKLYTRAPHNFLYFRHGFDRF